MSDDYASTMSLIGGQNERLDTNERRTEEPSSLGAQPTEDIVDDKAKGKALHPFVRDAIRNKIYGALIGSAVEDCIRLYTEFMTKLEAEETYPERSFRLTDPVTPLKMDGHRTRFGTNGLRALQTRPLGLGQTVATAVYASDFLDDPNAASYRGWERGHFNGAANGSLMRCHPLGAICVYKSLTETFEIATEYGLVTHPDPRCIVSCCILVGLIRGLLLGEPSSGRMNGLLRDRAKQDQAARCTEPSLDHEELWEHVSQEVGDLRELDLDGDGSIGYVYKARGAAIYVLRRGIGSRYSFQYGMSRNEARHKDIFETQITDLIMEAGDADTNAALAGALLGAFLGYCLLPEHWRCKLKYGEFLEKRVEGLCQMLGVGHERGNYDGKKDSAMARDGGDGVLRQKKRKSENDLGKTLKKLKDSLVE